MKQTRTLDYNFRWEIAKVANNLKHVAQLQIEATIFKGRHSAQIQQLRGVLLSRSHTIIGKTS